MTAPFARGMLAGKQMMYVEVHLFLHCMGGRGKCKYAFGKLKQQLPVVQRKHLEGTELMDLEQ